MVLRLGRLGELRVGHEVDAGFDERGLDRAGQERAVVTGVVPGQPALIETVLPEGDGEPQGLDRLLAVDDDLPLVVDLGTPETPGHGIRPLVGIAEAVAEGLTDRMALLLELGPDSAQLA